MVRHVAFILAILSCGSLAAQPIGDMQLITLDNSILDDRPFLEKEWPAGDPARTLFADYFSGGDIEYSRAHSRDPDMDEVIYATESLSNSQLEVIAEFRPPVLIIDTRNRQLEVPDEYQPAGMVNSKVGIGVISEMAESVNRNALELALRREHGRIVFNSSDDAVYAAGRYVICSYLGIESRDCETLAERSENAEGYDAMMRSVMQNSAAEPVLAAGVRGIQASDVVDYADVDGHDIRSPSYPLWVTTAVFIDRDRLEEGVQIVSKLIESTASDTGSVLPEPPVK